MPMHLEGSCACGAVRFDVESHTPAPYQLCYCSICRKSASGGGPVIAIGGDSATLNIEGEKHVGTFQARIVQDGKPATSPTQRKYCTRCGATLWGWDPRWPDLVHPVASVIDTALPVPPVRTHVFLASKPDWLLADIRPGDLTFDGYPEQSLEDWHKAHGLWEE